MEVNWDEIEQKYVEVRTQSVGNFNYSPQSTDDTTIIDNNSVPNCMNTMSVQNGLETQRPDVIDESGPSVVNRVQILQKPDGA